MFRKSLSIVFIFSLIFLLISCSDDSTNPLDYGSGDDYMIYQKLLQDHIPDQKFLIVLNDSTYGGYTDTTHIKYYKSNIPDLSYETLSDYTSRNKSGIKLQRIPDITNLVFRSEFKIKRPDTVSVTFSRIGYNALKTQAILYMSEVYGPLAGTGSLVFLKKENNTWIVAQVLMIWIS